MVPVMVEPERTVIGRVAVTFPVTAPDAEIPRTQILAAQKEAAAAIGATTGAWRTRGVLFFPEPSPGRVLKVASRRHESLEALLSFDSAASAAGVLSPRVLRSGSGPRGWWALLEWVGGRAPGSDLEKAVAGAAHSLAALHSWTPPPAWWPLADGCRVDSPGNIALMFAMLQRTSPNLVGLAQRYAEAVAGRPAKVLHSDAGGDHNVLLDREGRVWLIDPGAHRVGPVEHDLATAQLLTAAAGGDPDWVLARYPEMFDVGLVVELARCLAPRLAAGRRSAGEADRAARMLSWASGRL